MGTSIHRCTRGSYTVRRWCRYHPPSRRWRVDTYGYVSCGMRRNVKWTLTLCLVYPHAVRSQPPRQSLEAVLSARHRRVVVVRLRPPSIPLSVCRCHSHTAQKTHLSSFPTERRQQQQQQQQPKKRKKGTKPHLGLSASPERGGSPLPLDAARKPRRFPSWLP